ncbi:hypothetical protein LINPERHAP1_LOCUS27542 [Linum perenne]
MTSGYCFVVQRIKLIASLLSIAGCLMVIPSCLINGFRRPADRMFLSTKTLSGLREEEFHYT